MRGEGIGRGLFFYGTMKQEKLKTIAFIDGQNLFYSVQEAFGYGIPNYDPQKLAKAVCKKQGWILKQTRFYTGIPNNRKNPHWHSFWTKKISKLKAYKNIFVFSYIYCISVSSRYPEPLLRCIWVWSTRTGSGF